MMDYYDEVMKVLLDSERLGSRRLSNGVHLIGHVPHVAPDAYCHVVYPPLEDAHIATIEQQIQRRLPSELKDFYRHSNGLHLFVDTMAIDGLRGSNVRIGDGAWQPFSMEIPNVKERPKDAGSAFVFFGGYEWDGSTLGMSPDSPVVHRCAPQSARFINEWPSFGEMLVSEVRRLSALFDASGRKISEESPTVPE